jgi:hypothetical protein
LEGSKVREPVYHKTNKDFTEFDIGKTGENDYGYAGQGAYFLPTPLKDPMSYGNISMKTHLSIKNPYERNSQNWNDEFDPYKWISNNSEKYGGIAEASKKWTEIAKERGFDGFIDNATKNGEIVAFDKIQIKSATGNRGTFDPTDPNILHGLTLGSILPNRDRVDSLSQRIFNPRRY